MEENIKKQILEIIRETINEIVYDEMKQMPSRLEAKQNEMKKTKAQMAQDAHDALFGIFGSPEDDGISYRLKLHESENKPRVSSNELEAFETEFKGHFPGISFDKQVGGGKNGQIVDFPLSNGQKDAVTSGVITIGQEKIGFSMSLLNGFRIKSIIENGQPKSFEIKKETKDAFSKILNLYDTVFKEKFNGIINPSGETGEQPGEVMAPPAAAPTPEATPAPEAAPAPAPAV